MFQVVLSDIQWAGQRKDLPSRWTYDVDDWSENEWQKRLDRDFRGNKIQFRRLLHDVFHVEAERQHGCAILKCRMTMRKQR